MKRQYHSVLRLFEQYNGRLQMLTMVLTRTIHQLAKREPMVVAILLFESDTRVFYPWRRKTDNYLNNITVTLDL